MSAREHIDGPFCVINADDRYGPDAYRKMYTYLSTQASPDRCAMVGYILENTLSPHGTVNRGICKVDADAHLVRIQEHLKIGRTSLGIADKDNTVFSADTIVSMNFW